MVHRRIRARRPDGRALRGASRPHDACAAGVITHFGTTVAVAGPVVRAEVVETGTTDRAENMTRFTTIALTYLRDAILDAPAKA